MLKLIQILTSGSVNFGLDMGPRVLNGAQIWAIRRPILENDHLLSPTRVPGAQSSLRGRLVSGIVVLLEGPGINARAPKKAITFWEQSLQADPLVLLAGDDPGGLAFLVLEVGGQLAGPSDEVGPCHTMAGDAGVHVDDLRVVRTARYSVLPLPQPLHTLHNRAWVPEEELLSVRDHHVTP